MSSRHKRDTRPATGQSQEPPPEADDQYEDSVARAAEATASAASVVDDIDAILDDADESLHAALGFEPGQKVDPAELDARAAVMVSQYQQKGGQ